MLLQYGGIAKNGEKVRGEFYGIKAELIEKLRTEDILITSINEKKRNLKGGKNTSGDFSMQIEELSYLVSSGLQIDKAVITLAKNLKKKSTVDLWNDILSELREGKQLSAAMKYASKKQKFAISDFYINIISVGEEVGNIQGALKNVSEHLQFRDSILKDTISALSYPVFLLAVTAAAIFFIAYFILPRFATIFTAKEMTQIPVLSRLLIEFGQFVNGNTGLVLFSVFVVISIIFIIFSLDKPRQTIISLMRRLPIIRGIAFELEIANVCSSIGVMLTGGVDAGKAMRLAGKSTSDNSLKNVVEETTKGLREGLRISEMWGKYSMIPDDVVSLVAAGENSAKLGDVFNKLGKRHLQYFKAKVAKAMTFLEPAMIIFLGVIIGGVVVSIMMAILSLTNVT